MDFTEKLKQFLGLSPHPPDYGPQYQLWSPTKPVIIETLAQALERKLGMPVKKRTEAKKAALRKVHISLNPHVTKAAKPAILAVPAKTENPVSNTKVAPLSNTKPTVV